MQPTTPPTHPDEITIRLSDVVRFFRVNGRRIGLVTAAFTLVGVVVSLLSPIEYTSEAQIMSELQGKSNIGQFQSLADLAGINLDNIAVTDAVRPDLYPNIIQSKPFLISLMALTVRPGGTGTPQRLDAYLRSQTSVLGEARKFITNLFKPTIRPVSRQAIPAGSGILMVSWDDEKLMEGLGTRVQAGLDKKTGLITVSAKMPDPVIAAVVSQYALDYLTQYVIAYRTEKTRYQVDFLSTQVAQAQARFQAADVALRGYRDRTRNPFFMVSGAEETRRQTELNLAQGVYTDLARQLDQAKVRMREESPVFKVLEPPQVPIQRSEPRRKVMVLATTLLGFLLATAYSFFRQLV